MSGDFVDYLDFNERYGGYFEGPIHSRKSRTPLTVYRCKALWRNLSTIHLINILKKYVSMWDKKPASTSGEEFIVKIRAAEELLLDRGIVMNQLKL